MKYIRPFVSDNLKRRSYIGKKGRFATSLSLLVGFTSAVFASNGGGNKPVAPDVLTSITNKETELMEEAIATLQHTVLTVCAIALASAVLGYLIVGRLLKTKGVSKSTRLLVGNIVTVVTILICAYFFIVNR